MAMEFLGVWLGQFAFSVDMTHDNLALEYISNSSNVAPYVKALQIGVGEGWDLEGLPGQVGAARAVTAEATRRVVYTVKIAKTKG